jgi:hypothetical protein
MIVLLMPKTHSIDGDTRPTRAGFGELPTARWNSIIVCKVAPALGRMFRYYLWGGVLVTVNGIKVQPTDPLYLHDTSP